MRSASADPAKRHGMNCLEQKEAGLRKPSIGDELCDQWPLIRHLTVRKAGIMPPQDVAHLEGKKACSCRRILLLRCNMQVIRVLIICTLQISLTAPWPGASQVFENAGFAQVIFSRISARYLQG